MAPDLEALAFLLTHPCRLVGEDRIQLPGHLIGNQVDSARRLKPQLLALLHEARRDEAEERAGILEYQAGFSRAEAEHLAGLVAPMQQAPPLKSAPNQGLGCPHEPPQRHAGPAGRR